MTDYAWEITSECSEKRAEMSMVRLRALNKEIGGLATLTSEDASKYLVEMGMRSLRVSSPFNSKSCPPGVRMDGVHPQADECQSP